MDSQPGLLLNDAAFARVPEQNKPVFIYDWLRSLDRRLSQSTKTDVRNVQSALIDQLMAQVSQGVGPPSRKLLGRCLAKIFTAGDSISLYKVLDSCNDILKERDDNPTAINKRLTALTCLGIIYRSLGRLCGRSFEETAVILMKMMKQVESQTRCEILTTLREIVTGFGSAEATCFRDIYKIARSFINDRVPSVRLAAAQCLNSLAKNHVHFFTGDLDGVMSMCIKGLEGSNHAVRMEIAKLLGFVLAKTQLDSPAGGINGNANQSSGNTSAGGALSNQITSGSRSKPVSLDDVFTLLSSAFIRGPGRFHKGPSGVSREVRAGINYAYIEFFDRMGSEWLVTHSQTVITHCLSLLIPPPRNALSTASASSITPSEAAFTRLCVGGHLLPCVLRRYFSEAAQIAMIPYLLHLISMRQQRKGKQSSSGLRSQLSGLGRGLRSVGSTGQLSDASQSTGSQQNDEITVGSSSPGVIPDDPNYLVCCLDVLTEVIRWLDSTVAPILSSPTILDTLFDVCLSHPALAVRVSAAAALRQLAIALPSQRVPLMDRCMTTLSDTSASPTSISAETISGYSLALGGLVAGASLSDLGIPCSKGKAVFSLAEDLLRAANQNSRLTTARTQAGWYLLGACMTLGSTTVRPHLPRLILLWRNAFPRSTRELEAEKQRGDAFTWQVTIEARAGALCSMQAFLQYCAPAMAKENVSRRLLPPLECALNFLGIMPDIVKTYGSHLSAPASLLRLRLYRCLALLPPTSYSSGFNVLLRELVAEFTLTDSSSTTAVCLAGLLGQSEDSVVLNSWCRASDQQIVEDAIEQHNFCCPGSIGNDSAYLFLQEGLVATISSDRFTVNYSQNLILEGQPEATSMSPRRQAPFRQTSVGDDVSAAVILDRPLHGHANPHLHRQGPPVLASQVIEAAIDLFGLVFPFVSTRHRIQMLEHFTECIRVSKAARQEAIQVNIFAALLCAWRHLSETKYAFGDDKTMRSIAVALTSGALSSSNPVLRFAAAECIGRLVQVVGEASFLSEIAQTSFDQLRCLRDSQARAAGLCATIGCLHRFVGGLACGQHLNTSVSVLLAVAQDSSAPTVQAWALNALALTAESGGPMFREFVQPSLSLVLRLLLKTPFTVTDIHFSLANLLGALITTLGPELQSSSGGVKSDTGISCLLCCSILLEHPDPHLQAEGITNFQRIHVFAPHLINLSLFAPILSTSMTSNCFALRRASIACIRQISQKDADNLCDVMATVAIATESLESASSASTSTSAFIGSLPGVEPGGSLPSVGVPSLVNSESFPRLEAVLFSLLDVEIDSKLRGHLEEAISSLLQARGLSHFQQWMKSLKQLLQQSATTSGSRGLTDRSYASKTPNGSTKNPEADGCKDEDVDEDDDEQTFGGISESQEDARRPGASETVLNLPPRWPTRILAIACLRRLMSLCQQAADFANSGNANTTSDIGLRSPQITRGDLSLRVPNQMNQQRAHFDLTLAGKLRQGLTDVPWLVLHLGDLVRVTFIAATSNSDHLRKFGLFALKQVIQLFATVSDPESAGTYILEQFQAQISAALRPAFSTTSTFTNAAPLPDITAAACEVCACWLTSGVTQDAADFRRVHELLTASLEILRDISIATTSTTTNLFSEACVTRLKLAVLTAWAEVFIAASRYRETALQSLQLLSMLESHASSSADGLSDVVQRQLLLMLSGNISCGINSGSWGQPSIKDSSKLLESLEQEFDEVDDFSGDDNLDEFFDEDASEDSNASGEVKRKIFIRKTRRAVKEARKSYQLLSRLIGPDLAELASDWLAALRDYALINLPDELAFQRPTTAGAFYDSQTGIEAVRPFYARSWLPLLEAATLCLNTEAKDSTESTSYFSGEAPEKHMVIPMTRDSFFLIFGIALEAISDVISKPSSFVVAKCLRIIELLLMNPASKTYIFSSTPRLPVELLSVLHRIVLTRDSISLHLGCLRVLHLLLAAAADRLKSALIADLNPSGNEANTTETEAASVWLETGQSLDELLSIVICPMATDMEAVLRALELADGGSRSCFNETPETASQFTLTALQVIVCLLARYHPSVLQLPIAQPVPTQRALPSFPKTVAAGHRKAPVILASAIHALTALMKIASPEILSTNPERQLSGVLPVMCRLVSRIAQLELLQSCPSPKPKIAPLHENSKAPDNASLGSTSTLSTIVGKSPLGPPDLESISASAFKTSTSAETAITSTSSGTNDSAYNATATAAETASTGYASLNAKLGWSQEQACLADALVSFLSTVAQHHCYRTNLVSAITTVNKNDGGSEDNVATENEDSAVSSSSNPTSPNYTGSSSASKLLPGDAPPCEWHQLVIACLLTFIQHEHVNEELESPERTLRCCLAASYLSARIVAASPLAVFRCRAVEFGIFEALTRAWTDASNTGGYPLSTAPLCGATTRAVCLSAIEMLVNHSDADVSSCCVKTLMPQVFHWLYELSVASALSSGAPFPTSLVNDVVGETSSQPSRRQCQHFFVARLEEAVASAIALSLNVVDIAEASGRQNLLAILLPLFCDLLHDPSSESSSNQAKGEDGMTAVRQMLHRLALRNLLTLGSRYPAEFRHVVSKVSSLKPRIEAAVKAAGSTKNTTAASSSQNQQIQQQKQPRAPIKLKIGFSNFTS
nr:HEAT repeat containing protein 5B [Hymenolepis microstoma]